jgi:hypothetical protein
MYNCFPYNIIWTDRGIILTIIYYILKKYNKLLDKIIIIDNTVYRHFISHLFPELIFKSYNKHMNDNFYFNIRNIIKEQDIVITHINSINNNFKCDKVKLVPWFDINDPIVAFEISNKSKNKYDFSLYNVYIKNSLLCKRGKYINGVSWDLFIEYNILKKFTLKNNINFYNFYNFFNSFISKYYIHITNTNTKYIEKPVYYVYNQSNNNNNRSNNNNQSNNNNTANDETIKNINNIIKLFNTKIKLIYNL